MEVGILGGGRWGTALAMHLARKGVRVLVYDVNEKVIEAVNSGKDPYFGTGTLPEGVRATSRLKDMEGFPLLVCALPTQVVREVFSSLSLGKVKVVNASKGLEVGTMRRVTQIIEETNPDVEVFALSGPSFAKEVAQNLPTAVALGYKEGKESAEEVQKLFSNTNFRVYLNPDLIGVELGGALKNVIAIACGISDGLGFGYNARSALITRGLVEMARIGVRLGAKRETFFGLSGAGDLILTATSDLSRNRTFGLMLGRGLSPEEAFKKIGQVVEGAKTVEALKELTDKLDIYAPITDAVFRTVVLGEDLHRVVRDLLLRSPGTEMDL